MEEVLIDKCEPSYFYNHQKAPAVRPFPSAQPHKPSTVIPSSRHDIKDTKNKGVESNTKSKNTERDLSTLNFIIKCYNCQDYGHTAANCPTLFKIIIIEKVSIEAPKPDSIIFPKVTHVTKEFNVVFPAVMATVPFCSYHN